MNARFVSLAAPLVLLLAARAAGADPAEAAARARALAARTEPVGPAEERTLAAREPGSSPEDYTARTVTLRVFGVQNVGTADAFATVADAGTWATRDYRVGDALGRNLVVRAVEGDALVLAEGGREVRLGVGRDVPLRLVEHAFDGAVSSRGGHDYEVDAGVLSRVRARYGAGATGEIVVLDRPAVKLQAVEPRGVFARLGLEEGDLLWSFDGEPVRPENLDRIASALATEGTGPHALDVLRHGVGFTAVYYPAHRP